LIAPDQAQLHFDALSSAATPPIFTCADPGAHGLAITGRQGWGTSGPAAEAVATCGLDNDVHMPKAGMLLGPMSLTTPAAVGPLTAAPPAAKLRS
jgi:hypothetical protein